MTDQTIEQKLDSAVIAHDNASARMDQLLNRLNDVGNQEQVSAGEDVLVTAKTLSELSSSSFLSQNLMNFQASTTINIGLEGQPSSIQDAWNSLKGKTIIGSVIIKVPDGTHNILGKLVLSQQPYAQMIRIEGNVSNPENCVLNFQDDGSDNCYIAAYNIRGLNFSGFKIKGRGSNTQDIGLRVDGSWVLCDQDSIIVEDCHFGLQASWNSRLECRGVRANNCYCGVYTSINSYSYVPYAKIHSSLRDTVNTSGIFASSSNVDASYSEISGFNYGFWGHDNSTIGCVGSDVSDCFFGAYCTISKIAMQSDHVKNTTIDNCNYGFVMSGSFGIIDKANITNCLRGVDSHWNSTLYAQETLLQNHSEYALFAAKGGMVYAPHTVSKMAGNANNSYLSNGIESNEGALIFFS